MWAHLFIHSTCELLIHPPLLDFYLLSFLLIIEFSRFNFFGSAFPATISLQKRKDYRRSETPINRRKRIKYAKDVSRIAF